MRRSYFIIKVAAFEADEPGRVSVAMVRASDDVLGACLYERIERHDGAADHIVVLFVTFAGVAVPEGDVGEPCRCGDFLCDAYFLCLYGR